MPLRAPRKLYLQLRFERANLVANFRGALVHAIYLFEQRRPRGIDINLTQISKPRLRRSNCARPGIRFE